MIKAYLYDAQGRDREVSLPEQGLPSLEEHQLLWIDVTGREPAEIDRLAAALELKSRSSEALKQGARTFTLANYGDYIHFDVAAIDGKDRSSASSLKLTRSTRLDIAVGATWLLTVHDRPLSFLDDFREQDRGETLIGALTPSALAASLMDWHLETYLGALEDVEAFADRVDVRLLSGSNVRDDLLNELVAGRRFISSLRRSLSPQRSIFYGLCRPDIALIADTEALAAYKELERRFERVLDSIEHGRDLVQSSFDLFTTRTAETTNGCA